MQLVHVSCMSSVAGFPSILTTGRLRMKERNNVMLYLV